MPSHDTRNKIFRFISLASQVVVIGTAVGALAAWGSGYFAERLRAYVEEIHDANPQIEIVKTSIVVHTDDQNTASWTEKPTYVASEVGSPAQQYILDIDCPPGYEPAAAWHETTASHPSIDKMYTVDLNVTGSDAVSLTLRARQGASGYAYVDVLVLCRSAEGGHE